MGMSSLFSEGRPPQGGKKRGLSPKSKQNILNRKFYALSIGSESLDKFMPLVYNLNEELYY
jgi:hypothetical protein